MFLGARTKRQRLLYQWGSSALVLGLILAVLMFTKMLSPASNTGESQSTNKAITSVLSRGQQADVRFSFKLAENPGLRFRHFPAIRSSLLPEDMGSGLAWGDYDNDGDPDLFLVNFKHGIVSEQNSGQDGMHALYRNDGDGHFRDVTRQSGFTQADFGLGAGWGDYNNDGYLDLFISSYGANRLYQNNGDSSFADVTEIAGVGDDSFSTSIAWGDYDRDGHLDLYVNNYVQFDYLSRDQRRSSRQYESETP